MERRRYAPATVLFLACSSFLQRGFSLLVRLEQLGLACFNGLWLGILSEGELYEVSDHAYSRPRAMYGKDEWNRKGLVGWEENALRNHFPPRGAVLVAAAGGGREVLALRKRGYDADGFDCNARLVARANALLAKEGRAADVALAPPDRCPGTEKVYDGLIVGWGAYTHIQGRRRRVAFLREMRARVREGGPILLSFWVRAYANRTDLRAAALAADFLRALRLRRRTERGDALTVLGYAHYFDREEIAGELREGGFAVAEYDETEGGWAVGLAR